MRRRFPSWRRSPPIGALFLLLITVLVASGCGTSASQARTAASPTATGRPRQPTTPTPCDPATQWQAPNGNVALYDLALTSADEGWAVGGLTGQQAGVIYHLASGQWQRLLEVFPGAEIGGLSMGSGAEGWTVPDSVTSDDSTQVPVLHYHDGRWEHADIPALDQAIHPRPGILSGISLSRMSVQMFGPNAGWMYGQTNIARDPSAARSGSVVVLLRYLNGAWTPIPMPPISSNTELFALSAVSADEAWAVGTIYGSDQQTVFARFTSGVWSLVPQTFPGVTQRMAMLSPTDGWAFDSTALGDVLLHYDGAAWAPFPAPPHAAGQFTAINVFAMESGARWFVVSDDNGVGIEELANATWRPIAWPFDDMAPARLVVGAPGRVWGVGDIWHVVGCRGGFLIPQGVFLQANGDAWSRFVLP
jgi:hypothetical protein